MSWLDFCMFWLGFVYPRSHSGWIGPIGEFAAAAFIRQPAYRYSIPLPPDLPSVLRHWLRSSVKSYQYDSVTCFLYVLTGFCIPQVPFRLNWANWRIWSTWVYPETSLPVLHPSSPWLAFSIKAEACVPQSNRTSTMAWLDFCMFWLGFVCSRSHSDL